MSLECAREKGSEPGGEGVTYKIAAISYASTTDLEELATQDD